MPKCNRHIDCVACVLEREKCEQCCCPDISQFFEKIVEQDRRVKELERKAVSDKTTWGDQCDKINALQARIDAAVKCVPHCIAAADIYDHRPFCKLAEILNPKPAGKEGNHV